MAQDQFKRKLTTIFSADVAGYSRLMGEDESATVKTLEQYKQVMSELIRQHRGRVVDSPGDNLLAEFTSVVDAVQCAVATQKELQARNADLPENRRMQFRIGVNLGDVIEEESRIYGDGVNIAARLESLADPGGICVSKTAFDHIESKLPLGYEFLGEQTIKNIAKPVGAYRVLMEPRVTVAGAKEIPAWRTKRVLTGALAALIAIIGVGVWNFYWRAPKIEPASKEKMAFPLPDKPSIAVLPFVNMSGDFSQEFLSDGITENIITGLSQLNALFVIARNSTFTYKGKPVKVQQVAEDLGVRYVLEGSVQKSGERLRITAQFIDALKGHYLWSERYDRELRDLFAIEDDITKKIITALQVILTDGEQARIYARGTENLDAYLKFLEARENIFRFNKDSNLVARQQAEEAIALSPDYSNAHALLGKTYIGAVFFGWSPSPKEALRRSFESAKKALALDESNFQAHTVLAYVHLLKREHDAAVEECERAVSLAPNAADSFYNLGIVLRFAGKAREAISMFEKAIRLNPIPPGSYLYQLALSYTFVGEFEKAIHLCKEALSKNPDDIVGRVTLIVAYGSLGREEDVPTQLSELLRVDPKFSIEQAARTWPYKKESDREFVLAGLRKAGLPDKPPLPLPDKPSIAVLPFVNMSDDKSQEYFSDGLTEEIITALSKTTKLFVIARNSTFVYKGKPVKVQQVSRELGVKYVLVGSVRWSGDQLRITAQLIDATTGNHLWAERYDRKLKDLFAIQDEVTMKILTSLQVTLTEGESGRSFDRGTDSLEAYLKTIEGRELMHAMNMDDNALARRKFEEAIELDPKFARAYAGLSFAHSLDFMFGVDPKESLRKAYEYAQKAIDIDEEQLLAHGALEFAYIWRRKHDMAIASGERAVQVAPGCADAYFYLGRALAFAGRYQESVSQLEKAIRMNPFPPGLYYMHLGMAQLSLRQYEQAVSSLKKALALNPKNISARRMLTVTYVEMGSLEDAKLEAEEILKIDPRFTSKGFEKIIPFKDGELTNRYMHALRMAGLEREI
jgi:adenylate cyclase